MKKVWIFLFFFHQLNSWAQIDKAPAYPLITHDPYFSMWSFSDTLSSSPTKHWTGADQPLMGIIKVDGKLYRFMGSKSTVYQNNISIANQKTIMLSATQTAYKFTTGGVDLKLTFTSPLLMNDLSLLSRPVSYVTCKVQSNDGAQHDVQVYFGASTNIAVNIPSQEVTTQKYDYDDLSILKAGTKEQPVLQKKGDDLHIDWGYMYVAVPKAFHAKQYISSAENASSSFQKNHFTSSAVNGKNLMLNTILSFGKVGSTAKEQTVLVGYDDLYAIQYFNQNLKAWWKNDPEQTIEKQLVQAYINYKKIMARCRIFNDQLHKDALAAGGEEYAKLCALAYRQSIAAHKLVKSPQGELLFLSK